MLKEDLRISEKKPFVFGPKKGDDAKYALVRPSREKENRPEKRRVGLLLPDDALLMSIGLVT